MKRNIGTLDMTLRLIAGATFGAIGFFNNPVVSGGLSKVIVACFALLLLATGLLRYCPLYPLIGVNTCKSSR
ncbi:MAG TPA: DUF2892 domain-containing protein [Desulfuromonadales bacterium]|nr:DUF2892 domain-containing protein [Desulfuromonadales bacterium]